VSGVPGSGGIGAAQVFWQNSIGNRREEGSGMPGTGLIFGIASLVFGIIVLVFPKILNYLVGIYLIVVGLIAIFLR